MIWFYSGTPGSGKSLHVARDIYAKLRRGGSVIASFPVNLDMIKKNSGRFTSVELATLHPKFFYDYAREHHVMGKEAQTLVILDECQIIFNPREFGRSDRLDWIKFFTQHRHLGYNFILISQFDRLVDRQIRSLFEYEVKHRKVNNYGIGMLLPVPTFCCVTYWYGVREKVDVSFFQYRKLYGKLYNSFAFFEEIQKGDNADNVVPVCTDGEQGDPVCAGGLDALIFDTFSEDEMEQLISLYSDLEPDCEPEEAEETPLTVKTYIKRFLRPFLLSRVFCRAKD